MRSKKDMYIDKNHTYQKKHKRNNRRNKRGSHKIGQAAAIVITIAIILGFSTFYIARDKFNVLDETRNTQEDLRNGAETSSGAKDAANNAKVEGISADQSALDSASKDETSDLKDKSNLQSSENVKDNNSPVNTAKITGSPENSTQSDSADTQEITDQAKEETSEEVQETFMPGFIDQRRPTKVKGIYVTGPRAGRDSYMKDLISLVDTTELNTMVIDIKNDMGEITYKMDLPEAQELHADVNYISDMKQLISELKEKNIYLIARVVAFKDPILAKGRPDLCLKKKDGSIFYDKNGLSWVNPYKKEVWEYLISVAKEAALLGFDEIQFDYIRFSTDSGIKDVDFGKEAKGKSKMDVITEFTKYACENLKPLGVYVSADVYGTIIDSKVDSEIVGQNYKEMSKYLDYISPMIYPSHYNDGAYRIAHPDLKPYELILSALDKSQTALKEVTGNKAVVRPWLQDFTATWLDNHKTYGPEEIRAQVKAVYDAGYDEWILWNGNNDYTKDGLKKD